MTASLEVLFVAALIAVTVTDLRARLVPNRVTGGVALIGLVGWALTDPGSIPGRLLAAALAGGVFLLAHRLSPAGMGMGDVKLVAVIGLFLRGGVVLAALVALGAGCLLGLALIARRGLAEGRRATIPFAPFLAAGALSCLLATGPAVGGG